MNDVAGGENTFQGPEVLTEGPFAGWSTWSAGADPYETAIGPFCFKLDGERAVSAFQPRRDHLNGGGTIHGGALMSFADFSLFSIAHAAVKDVKAVTLTCNSEFLAGGVPDELVQSTGEVLRETRSLIFVRGIITQLDRPLLAFSGTLKKIETKPRE